MEDVYFVVLKGPSAGWERGREGGRGEEGGRTEGMGEEREKEAPSQSTLKFLLSVPPLNVGLIASFTPCPLLTTQDAEGRILPADLDPAEVCGCQVPEVDLCHGVICGQHSACKCVLYNVHTDTHYNRLVSVCPFFLR